MILQTGGCVPLSYTTRFPRFYASTISILLRDLHEG